MKSDPAHLTADLIAAAENGELNRVRELLQKGASVDGRNEKGDTALRCACTVEIATLLLQHGADVNARNNSGFTPLHRAAWLSEAYGDPLVALYLEKGAEIDPVGEKGITPLSQARFQGNPKQYQRLLAAGANPNGGDMQVPTALEQVLELKRKAEAEYAAQQRAQGKKESS